MVSLDELSQSIESKMKQLLLDLIVKECELNESIQMHHSSPMSSLPSDQATSSNGQPLPKKRQQFEYDDHDLQSNSSELSTSNESALHLDEHSRMTSIEGLESSSLAFMKCIMKRVFTAQASSIAIERACSHWSFYVSTNNACKWISTYMRFLHLFSTLMHILLSFLVPGKNGHMRSLIVLQS
jgi:hypothetical protein